MRERHEEMRVRIGDVKAESEKNKIKINKTINKQ